MLDCVTVTVLFRSNLHYRRQIMALINNLIMCSLKVHWLLEIFHLFQIYWRGGQGCQWPFPAETASRHHSSGSFHAQSPQRSPLGPYSSHQTVGTGRTGQTCRDEANVTAYLTRKNPFRGRLTSDTRLCILHFQICSFSDSYRLFWVKWGSVCMNDDSSGHEQSICMSINWVQLPCK